MNNEELMEKFEFKFKKFITIDKESHDQYNDLKKTKDSFLYGEEFTKIFILAMTLGYKKGESKPIQNPLKNNIPTSVLTTDEKWMMISLYISTKNKKLEAIYDVDEILKNAEEYANGGFKYLWSIYQNQTENKLELLEEEFRQYL
jgi:hypothetical protein|tara:strand:+ start:280 stop:714 length:435 start_codon:yes stop_codon:yes gene_type:complete